MNIQQVQFYWSEENPIFSSEQYLQSVSDEYGWVGGFNNDEMSFVLPYIIKKKLFFRYLEFQTSTIYLNKELTITEEKIFLNKVIKFLNDKNIDFIKQPPTSIVFNTVPDEAEYAPFGSYIINLNESADQLWENVHSKHRNVIRRAQKDEIRIVRDKKYARAAYKMMKETMARSNMGFYLEDDYMRIINGLNNNVEVFMAFKDDVPHGCAVMPYSTCCAYYLLGGSIEHPSLGAMNLLQWEAIKYFKSIGVGRYDFVGARIKPQEGSKLEGIQRFKSRFGATMKTGYLWKEPINKWKYDLYKMLVRIKNRRKAVDIIEQEQNFSKKNTFNI